MSWFDTMDVNSLPLLNHASTGSMPTHPGYLKFLSSCKISLYVCVSACMSTPEAINYSNKALIVVSLTYGTSHLFLEKLSV